LRIIVIKYQVSSMLMTLLQSIYRYEQTDTEPSLNLNIDLSSLIRLS